MVMPEVKRLLSQDQDLIAIHDRITFETGETYKFIERVATQQ